MKYLSPRPMRQAFGLVFIILVLTASLSWFVPIRAAPISATFETHLALQSATCGVDEDGDTFVDEDPPNGSDDDNDGDLDEDTCSKTDLTVIKLEADLIVELTISGLTMSSTSVFTFKGLEYQAFGFSGALGAVSMKGLMIFAPSMSEIEFVRTVGTLSLRYCVRASLPGTIAPPFRACPFPDARLYWLFEDVGFYHPAVANLILARTFEESGMLDAPIIFRKQVFDISVHLTGLALGLHTMFANFGDDVTPEFRAGMVFVIEGQTVSGVLVRSETWLGARQGLECFGECKPLERLYGGVIVEEFEFQEEKLFIRNLSVAGVTFDLRGEMRFFSEPGATCSPIFCFVEISVRAPIRPLYIEISNTLRLGPDLQERFDYLITSFAMGEVSVRAIWYFYLGAANAWQPQLSQLISSFDPWGVQITSDLKLCTGAAHLFCSSGVAKHTLSVKATIDELSLGTKLIFIGLMKNFYQFWLDAVWKLSIVELSSSIVLSAKYLNALAVGIKVRF
ncbi:MAG: hypothetical protein RMJ90_01285 [Candidatus Bipolaricaulota bacterium]|nr:hypothetical protein [Candidatus Bipolaricaulota bacterium]